MGVATRVTAFAAIVLMAVPAVAQGRARGGSLGQDGLRIATPSRST